MEQTGTRTVRQPDDHQSPSRGRFGSLRTSWHHPELTHNAKEKLRMMDRQAAAMVEYQWDPATDSLRCIELNARFWGCFLHHGLYRGVDFPRLLVDGFLGRPPEPEVSYHDEPRSRLIVPAETGYVQGPASAIPRSASASGCGPVIELLLLRFNPRIRSDLLWPGDRMLYSRAAAHFVRAFFGRTRL
jgi:hypothetical protein